MAHYSSWWSFSPTAARNYFYYYLTLWTLCSLVSKTPAHMQAHTIHKRMTKEHLRDVFHIEEIHEVPFYVVTPVHIHNHDLRRLAKRSTDKESSRDVKQKLQLLLEAFDQKFHLNLQKVKHLLNTSPTEAGKKPSKVFYADMENGKPVLRDATSELSLTELEDALYQDIDNMAALSVRYSKDQDDGLQVELDGVVGNDYVVKPVPQDLLKIMLAVDANDGALIGQDKDDKNTTNISSTTALPGFSNSSDVNSTSPHYHFVYKRSLKASSKTSERTDLSEDGYIMSESDDVFSLLPAPDLTHDYGLLNDSVFVELPDHGKRLKRGSFPSHVVWPEVLVLVDFATYNLHGGNEKRITSYFATFWNAVDLRYRRLQQIDIRLQLSGIIISRNPAFMPYIEENRMPTPDDDSFDSKQALSDMAKYLFQQQEMLPKFDLAMVITKLDMCRKKDDEGPCVRGTAGFAYVGGACHVDESRQKLNKAGIVEDSGGFSGVIVAAHEVGHLLGCVHDGTAAPSYLGGPGAEACSWYDGYIMSDLRHNVNGFKWSSCSLAQFNHFLSRPQASCLFDSPMPGIRLGNNLPGKIIPLDWQCRLDRGTTACFKDERVCTQLYCHDKDTGYCIAFRPAAEGSPCGTGKNCRDGLCITDTETAGSDTSMIGPDRSAGLGPLPTVGLAVHSEEEPVCEGDVPGVRVSGMPCKEFLRVTGVTYCDHRDILRYCCNSRKIFCSLL